MSHDSEAAYASSEVADILMLNQRTYFGRFGTPGSWSVYAGREGGRQWPLADGVLLAQNATNRDIKIAFEYKRPNEGVHGILTALGQSLAYLDKGYDATVMVIPEKYTTHTWPGDHIKRVIDATAPDVPVSIYTYTAPNLSATRPFQGHISCARDICLPDCRIATATTATAAAGDVSTLWAHMREGMSHPDALFRFCQAVKIISSAGENLNNITIPGELDAAVRRIDPRADILKYLSNTSGDSILDMAWRFVWFNFYFWNGLMPLFNSTTPYTINNTATRIRIDDTRYQNLFSGRNDSIKAKLVDKLNATPATITEEEAWEQYAIKVRKDSHSYREVIDSGLFHLGFLLPDGNLSDLGYKYVDACERISTPYSGIPMEILRASILQNGQYGALLHYIYQLSEERFTEDMFAFTEQDRNGVYRFLHHEYLTWLDDKFANSLHILKKSTLRADGTRKPFQAEIAFLKKMSFVKTRGIRTAYRVGVGLEIDWPQVQNSMLYFQSI